MSNSNNLTPFKKGHKKIGGRKPGTPNKFPRELRAAIFAAAEILVLTTMATAELQVI